MIHCAAEGDPKPTIQWDRDSRMNNIDNPRFQVLSNGSFYIKEVYLSDEGKYGCTAGNSGGLKREEVELNVKGTFFSFTLYCIIINYNINSCKILLSYFRLIGNQNELFYNDEIIMI